MQSEETLPNPDLVVIPNIPGLEEQRIERKVTGSHKQPEGSMMTNYTFSP